MQFSVFGSGSKGNCYLIETQQCKVIIDCGLQQRYVKNCLVKAGISDLKEIDAVLLTHNHSDHCKNIHMFKFNPKYGEPYNNIEAYKPFTIKDLTITPIRLSHDVDCIGYLFDDGKQKLAQVTDTGFVSSVNEQLLNNFDYYIFESNHDVEMQIKSRRTPQLIRRVISDYGHLCNEDSANCLRKVIGPDTKEIVLAHISEECNKPGLPLKVLKETFDHFGVDYSNIKIVEAQQSYIDSNFYKGGSL